jgi:hypothetical protein
MELWFYRRGKFYILCNASRKSVVHMQFLTKCKLGILSFGVKRPCAKLATHPVYNWLRTSEPVPQWPNCFCGIGWDQFYSFITWKILSQAVFTFLSHLIGQNRNIFYASSKQRKYSHLQIEIMIKNIYFYIEFQIRYCGSQCERHWLRW